MAVTATQRKLTRMVHNLATGVTPGFQVGPQQKDMYGRQLDLRPESFSRLFSRNGKKVSREVERFLTKLREDKPFQLSIHAALKGYDMRVEDVEEGFWVLVAQAYAKSLVNQTGERDGHTIHLGQDCYTRHHRITSIFAYTLIKSGICDNGGGIVNWGATDGGSMKLMGTLERAQTGKNGNWAYGTVSHKTKPGLAGLKIGMQGEVVCVEELEEAIFKTVLEGNFLPLKEVSHPEEYVVNVADTTPYQTGLAERMIRARTNVSDKVRTRNLLDGLPVGIFRDNNGLMVRVQEMSGALGAEIIHADSAEGVGEPSVVRDPHENELPGVKEVLTWIEEFHADSRGQKPPKEYGRIHVPYLDPDGDRGGIGSIISQSRNLALNTKGTGLLMLAAHNLATYNPLGLKMGVVADMRALFSANSLGAALNEAGSPIDVYPGVPGYNMFHLGIAKHDAVLGIEDTSHTIIRPSSHLAFGAPKHYPNLQGGDNAGLFQVFLLGLAARMWKGRTMAEQLYHIHTKFQVPLTYGFERKPQLIQSHGMAKIAVGAAMSEIVTAQFGNHPNYTLTPFDVGISIESIKPAASLILRYSKSGNGFTLGAETVLGDSKAQTFVDNLVVALFMEGMTRAEQNMADTAHPYHAIRDFRRVVNFADAADIAAATQDPAAVIAAAAVRS